MSCKDESIIELILKMDRGTETEAVHCLLKCERPTTGLLVKMGLREADERHSLFYHAVAEFILKVRNKKFVLTGAAKICSYIAETAKRQWLNLSRKNRDLPDEAIAILYHNPEEKNFDELHKAINKLDEKYRNIIVSFYLYNHPLTEFAEQHGLTHDAAKQRLRRARNQIKVILKNDDL